MTKLTTERLEELANATTPSVKYVGREIIAMARQLLAYEQAAEKPYGYLEPCDFPRTTATVYPEKDKYAFMPLYAAQVLPKQPELVESLKKVMKSWLAMEPKLAFQPEFTDVMMLLDAEPAPAQPVIPEQQTVQLDPHVYRELVNELRDVALEYHSAQQLRERISRALSKAVTAAHPHLEQPVSEPYKLPVGYFSYGSECGFDWHNTEKEAIEAAEAVIDDYLGDACDGWSEETDSVCWGVILQQAKKVDERPRTDDDKCDPAIDMVCEYALLPELVGNSPVIPEGWKLVPVNATRAMIDAAARVEEDGYDAMHKAMLAVAPAREQK